MNLDDLSTLHQLDSLNMLAEIDALPTQLEQAYQLGATFAPLQIPGITRLVISGMGGSAIGADLLAAAVAATCSIPITVHRDYGLPAWARGPETLVVASSHSGNTEETLDSFDTALINDCRLLVICTGGQLEARARQNNVAVWKFDHRGQPRAAVGFSFGLLLAALARLQFIPDPASNLQAAVNAMRAQQASLRCDVPVASNPAKRLAGQMVGRWVNIYGAGLLAPVARRWKGQVNELAKAGAGFEVLPEANHNALAGLLNPAALDKTITIFLRTPQDHPRHRLRSELTQRAFLAAGLNSDAFTAPGDSPLAHMWTTLHFGDYVAFYLALAYGVDPTPVEALQEIKAQLSRSP